MGWRLRNRVPSKQALKAYDDRMSAREYEIRRPARKIDVISNEDYDRMLQERAEERRKEQELQMLWQIKHLDAIRQRNNMIRYKLFLIFKENFNIDTSNADTVSKQPQARAIAAVCNSITKDSVAYTQMTSFSEESEESEEDEDEFPWDADLLRDYIGASLGIDIDRDDIWSIKTAVEEKKTLLELISSQVERDLKEVTAALELHKKLPSIPGYSNPKFAEMLKEVVMRCIDDVDDDMLQNDGTLSKMDDRDKQYVAAVHKAFDEASIDRGLAGIMEGGPDRLRVDPEQLRALKSLLNTKASIRAFYDFCTDNEWSKNVEGLSEEKKVLEALIDSESDAVLRTINETIAEAYLTHNKLVEESAKVRNYVCSSREGRFGMGGRLGGVRTAGNTEEFEKAFKEESVKFKGMENDMAYKKLFPSSDSSEEHIYREVDMFTMSGFM